MNEMEKMEMEALKDENERLGEQVEQFHKFKLKLPKMMEAVYERGREEAENE